MSNTPSEYETRAALHDLADALADHLTTESGETWTAAPVEYLPERNRDHDRRGRAAITGASFTRARDGYTVRISPSLYYNEKDKGRAGIVWPKNPDPTWAASTLYREAPGVDYGAAEPGFKFTVAKTKPRALARRILRELTGEKFDAARAALALMFEEQARDKAACAAWGEQVKAAAGVRELEKVSYHYWHDSRFGLRDEWAAVGVKDDDRPGGFLSIPLPDDPGEAAALVARLRAVVEDVPADFKAARGAFALLDCDPTDPGKRDAALRTAARALGFHGEFVEGEWI